MEAVAPTDYGYWIDPIGKIIAVDYQKHGAMIQKLAGVGIATAVCERWVRVIAYNEWLAVEFRDYLTPITARAVKKLTAAQRYNDYTLDWMFYEGTVQEGERFETKDKIAFLDAVDEKTK